MSVSRCVATVDRQRIVLPREEWDRFVRTVASATVVLRDDCKDSVCHVAANRLAIACNHLQDEARILQPWDTVSPLEDA